MGPYQVVGWAPKRRVRPTKKNGGVTGTRRCLYHDSPYPNNKRMSIRFARKIAEMPSYEQVEVLGDHNRLIFQGHYDRDAKRFVVEEM